MRLRHNLVLVVFILSGIARCSGGIYDPLLELTSSWRKNPNVSIEERFIKESLTPLMRCAKPNSIEDARWAWKTLSNDQTAFTGFTSLLKLGQGKTGYEGEVTLLPLASFVEPFILSGLSNEKQERLLRLNQELRALDSTRLEEIDLLLKEANRIAPPVSGRKKGKSPLFFYSVTDKPFQISKEKYEKMVKATELVTSAFSEVAARYRGNLEEAIYSSEQSGERQFYTGSIDFMLCGEDIYLIDLGSPAVGLVADILFASEALGLAPDFGNEKLAQASNSIRLYRGKAEELGFFKLELEEMIKVLAEQGVKTEIVPGDNYEASINGLNLPTANYDYLTRNQPLRNKVLEALRESLNELDVRFPEGIICPYDCGEVIPFYSQKRLGEDDGLLVKKKVLFREYAAGSSYYKPLVIPLWSKEIRANSSTSTLFEQFIPSLVETSVRGDRAGKRAYEIRLYYCWRK